MSRSFETFNNCVLSVCDFYLNSKASDVYFLFNDDMECVEKVPAHKLILSYKNPVFDAMFYGPMRERGDIRIVDALAEAFKEFLQFFYLDKVRLTLKNIVEVMNLCKKYDMNESLNVCEIVFQNLITIDDMCFGYNIASLLERKTLIAFCEQQIRQNPRHVFNSDTFLESGRDLFEKLLSLVSCDWSALEMVIASMEWAKAECNRNELELNSINLRAQLTGILNKIPFEKLANQDFSYFIDKYKGFFFTREIDTLITKTLMNSQLSNPFELTISNIHEFDCDRKPTMATNSDLLFVQNGYSDGTKFSSNKELLLVEFFSKFNYPDIMSFMVCKIDEDLIIKLVKVNNLSANICQKIPYIRAILPEPLLIHPGQLYCIKVSNYGTKGFVRMDSSNTMNKISHQATGTEINFVNTNDDFVTRLIFHFPNNLN